ncbi:MAG: GLUG motif-containing protein [Planctomycetota bacterium]|jgi:hypothetical protein
MKSLRTISRKGCVRISCGRNRKLKGLFLVLFLLWCFGPPVEAKYSGGSGTAEDPYEISTAADMNAIGTDSNDFDKYFVVTNDIDMSSIPGTAYNLIYPFTGVFDGNNHAISNFSYTPTTTGGCGLISNVDGGVVKNLGLINPNVDGGTSWAWLGSLAGYIEGGATISNCYVKGGSVCGGFNIGGLVGEIDTPGGGTVSNCYATCNVTGSSMCIGGLVGRIESGSGGTITKCYATGSVTLITNPYADGSVGGLLGSNRGGSITESYATGSVVGADNGYGRIGGLVGGNSSGTSITNCCATGSVSGTNEVGGLAGGNFGVITNSYSTGSVSGTSEVGGLVGNDTAGGHTGTAANSFWDEQTSGKDTSAGGTGLMTADMQTRSTFTDAGWDFTDENANGTEDIWRLCVDLTDYPRFAWQKRLLGDFLCPDGSDFKDYAVLAGQWQQAPGEPSADIAPFGGDGIVDGLDLRVLCDNWLAAME